MWESYKEESAHITISRALFRQLEETSRSQSMMISLSESLVVILLKVMDLHSQPDSDIPASVVEDRETKLVDLLKKSLHRIAQSSTVNALNLLMVHREEALASRGKRLTESDNAGSGFCQWTQRICLAHRPAW